MSAQMVPRAISELHDAGVSIWLDDLSRRRITSGELATLIATRGVVGITTNPTIFAAALEGPEYQDQFRELASADTDAVDAVNQITTDDVRDAADILRPIFDAGDGQDGRVSIEVDPALAHDADRTVRAAKYLWHTVNRPNILIKIPATLEGLQAITRTLAMGISVNVTLIFSMNRYALVMDAFCRGLEAARENGWDLRQIASVASFFVSRVDTAADKALEVIGTPGALALRGQAAIANARAAFSAYEVFHGSPRFHSLAAHGAHPQRPLWASTGVKNPAYRDTRYVEELVTRGVVNTMPQATLEAVADHGEIRGDTVRPMERAATQTLVEMERAGLSLTEITARLESDGVQSFAASWERLILSTSDALRRAHAGLTR